MSTARIFPVIMAGGASSRLWPASGKDRPKWALQVAAFGSEGGKGQSLLEDAFARACAVAPAGDCLVVTAQTQAELVRRTLPLLPPENVLTEPQARDTAGAVAFAAGAIQQRLNCGQTPGVLGVMLVLPGDAVIRPVARFAQCVAAGAQAAQTEGALVTLGITPRTPATSFGYIHRGAALASSPQPPLPAVHQVLEFREKPDRQTAEAYQASGAYFWNAGIFIWSVAALLSELERQLPPHAAFVRALAGAPVAEQAALVARHYADLKKISIDFGVMEHAQKIAMVAADFEWDDIGSWSALGQHLVNDAGNAVARETQLISLDSRANVVFAPGKQVALVGVVGLAVVAAGDKILVCKLERDQDVKKISELAGQ